MDTQAQVANANRRNKLIKNQGILYIVEVRVGDQSLGMAQPVLDTRYFRDEIMKNEFIDAMLTKAGDSYVLITEAQVKTYERNQK